jgi:uncharacterized protein (TIGR00159 family)
MTASFFSYYQQLNAIEVLDLLIVLLLVFQLFRALRHSVAFNIFVGSLVVYIIYFVVKRLQMPLMSEILDRLVSIGLIGLIVVFQPEIRKFLISVGRRSPLGKNGFVSRLFQSNALNKYIVEEEVIEEITQALRTLQQKKLGAILVFHRYAQHEIDSHSGNWLNARLSAKLLESIFMKESPLHDGAVFIDKDIILAAGVVLPISDNQQLPAEIGLRHRSAVGASEHHDGLVVVLSEETSQFSIAKNGQLEFQIPMEDVKRAMYEALIA